MQGGANAGHTIYDAAGTKYALHLVPSGILNPGAQCVIGNGVVVHVPGLFAEIDALEAAGVKVRLLPLVHSFSKLLIWRCCHRLQVAFWCRTAHICYLTCTRKWTGRARPSLRCVVYEVLVPLLSYFFLTCTGQHDWHN